MEEERVVIELQAQFRNKWTRIATYLSGRTDNDVKNFWSSRQKRLARILQTAPPRPQPTPIITREIPVFHAVPIEESQELMARLEDPCFLDVFGGRDSEELGNEKRLGFFAVPSEGMGCYENGGKKVKEEKLMTPDSFFDDFPTDMFDHIEPLLSPSEW
ncbi:transcription factor DUO1-like isoform X1 [Malania oleifera]|uniref:transcription factor DUO1-like isoform X1 n=1 Tax=Malania oleifera TaxID=397392 RepID=UPI0025ADE0D1|nr:transcription factor DUO1-like isoform X1 [Malania oleifera]XP_057978855.1 transcription factor DUO1-like isoform X1 [Malania oleifera]